MGKAGEIGGWLLVLLLALGFFKVLANSVRKTEEEDEGEEPARTEVNKTVTKKERVKLERLKARLEAHVAAESVKEELERLKENPLPPVKPTSYQGGGTLPGARGDDW